MQRPNPDRSPRRRTRQGRLWRDLKRCGPGDYVAWGGALAMAALSVWFPWDVYLNESRYGPPELEFSRGGEIPADVIALQDGRAPLFDMVAETFVGDPPPSEIAEGTPVDPFTMRTGPGQDDREDTESESLPPDVDPITTASVPDGDAAMRVYRLLDAGRGLALIADTEGIYIVRPGAVLPDGRRVMAVVGSGGGARIVTGDRTEVRLD